MEIDSKRSRSGDVFLRTAIAAVVASSFSSGAALAQEGDTTTKLDTIEVTGSRLKRADVEGALPVTTISREQIEMSGNVSIADVLRNTSFNSFGSFRQQSGSSAQSVATLSLRGLGSDRTLILIDGRRVPRAPSAASVQDLNAIPLAAVERIEILQDGASAIYGSDAIGGVVNIILRKDFEGVQLSYQAMDSQRKGGGEKGASAIAGVNGGRGNVVVGVSYNKSDIVFARDSLYTVSPGITSFANNYRRRDPATGEFAGGYVTPLPEGCNQDGDDPLFSILPNGSCTFDFTRLNANEAEVENSSIFAKGLFEISDNWSFAMTSTVTRAQSFGRYAPALNDYPITVSAANPNNPIGEDIQIRHRFASLGPRDTYTDSNIYDILGVVNGSLGIVELDAGIRYNEYRYYEIGRNFVLLSEAAAAIEDGSYNFNDPYSVDQATLNRIRYSPTRDAFMRTNEVFANAQIGLFAMAGGQAQLGFGAEYRDEQYADNYDPQQESFNVGGTAGNSAGTSRTIRSVYTEVLLPVIPNLEVNAAVRYDEYSDYGNDTSPKLSVRYQPIDMLTLRAAWGEGFRAPTLDVISQSPQPSAEPVSSDEPTCIAAGLGYANGSCVNAAGQPTSVQVQSLIIANPQLESEKSDQYTFGFVVEPLDWMDVSLDYYSITIDNLITFLSPEDILDLINAGDPVPAGLGVTRDPTNQALTEVVAGTANQGELETSGIDLGFNMRFDFGAVGRLRTGLNASYVLEYKFDGGRDLAGDPGTPEMRANIYNEYSIWDFSVAYNINYIDSQAQTVVLGQRTGHIPSYTTHDIQFNYNTPFNSTVTLGALNVFDREPSPKSAADGRPYDYYLYDQDGRQLYVKYTQRF